MKIFFSKAILPIALLLILGLSACGRPSPIEQPTLAPAETVEVTDNAEQASENQAETEQANYSDAV